MSAEYNIYKKPDVISNCCSAGIEENSGRCLQCLEHCEEEPDVLKDAIEPLIKKILEPFLKPDFKGKKL